MRAYRVPVGVKLAACAVTSMWALVSLAITRTMEPDCTVIVGTAGIDGEDDEPPPPHPASAAPASNKPA